MATSGESVEFFMKDTNQKNPDDNRNPQKPITPISLPQRDSVTSLQVGTLLNIGVALMGVLLHPTREQDDPKWKDNKALDGGVLNSAEATFIGVCNRLDSIIADQSRWDFASQNTLEEKLSQVYGAHIEFTKAQTEAVRELGLPHRKFNPKLFKLPDGRWAAILGDMHRLDNAIIGVGITPEFALLDFDGIVTGKLPDHLVHLLAETEAKNEQHEHEQQVDKRTSKPARQTPKRRKVRARNRKRSGPNDKVG